MVYVPKQRSHADYAQELSKLKTGRRLVVDFDPSKQTLATYYGKKMGKTFTTERKGDKLIIKRVKAAPGIAVKQSRVEVRV